MSKRTPWRPRAVPPWLAGIVAVSLVFSTPLVARADKVTDAQNRAKAVQAQIDALDVKASIADEAYNVAHDRLGSATAKAAAAAAKVSRLRAQRVALEAALASQVTALYRSGGPLGMLEVLLGARSIAEFTYLNDVLSNISGQESVTVAALKRNEADAVATEKTLLASKADAARDTKAMAASAAAIRTQLAERQRVLDGIDVQIRTLIAQEQARRAAAARQAYLAYLARHRTPTRSTSSARTWLNIGGNPPSSARAATAVAWAKKALGKPYVWAASGPNAFDCSGLTMWAYAHAGVSLPHSSAGQISYGARVSRANLQPGDLVFFYHPIHHVGMYIGGGYFIEAPHTGGVVQITSLASRGSYAGACRP